MTIQVRSVAFIFLVAMCFTHYACCCCAEAEALGTKELELEGKTITIDLKSNEQGKFVKIIETHDSQSRGRVILSASKASELRSILNEFIAEHERLTPAEENSESERLKSYV